MLPEILKNAHIMATITINGKKEYTPSTFYITDSGIYTTAPGWGTFKRNDLTIGTFERHLAQMKIEGFCVTLTGGWIADMLEKGMIKAMREFA